MKLAKKLLAVLMSFVVIFATLPVSASAEEVISKSSIIGFAGGDGTYSNPYIIKTASQMDLIRNDLNCSYILDNSIDMSLYENWAPIGNQTTPFKGNFDGNGYIIYNLTIDYHVDTNNIVLGSSDMGLFGWVDGSEIINVGIENAEYNVTSGDFSEATFSNVGGIVGTMYNTKIINCYFKGMITNDVGKNIYSRAAGIAAIGNSSEIINCYSDAEIYANAYNMNTMARELLLG